MKTLYLVIISIVMATSLFTMHQVFAPCLVGVTSCGPPPGVTVVATTDNQFYEKNDTIGIQGQVYVENYTNPITVQVISPSNTKLESFAIPVINNTFSSKVTANFNTTGMYQIVTCVQNWCNRSYFKFVSEPYRLAIQSTDFLVKYKSFADLVGMEADVNSQALRVHISNATAQGLQFVIELPRELIDSKGYNGKDASFRVLIGMHQPDKYMQPANFTEIASSDSSRTLAIDIPYDPVPNSSGIWDFKIMPADVASGPAVYGEPPLKQFKSGISLDGISCKNGLYLAISNEKKPFCLKPGTISTLASRGLLYGTIESSGTTILIAPGSENPSSSNGYSPKNATVVIGVNNTVTWVNQSDTPNTIVSDMPITQNGKTFGSLGVIKSNDRYQFTFTEPGTYGYHTEPHPWMKGTIIVVNQTTNTAYNNPDFKLGPDLLGPIPHRLTFFMNANSTAKIFVQYTSDLPNTGTTKSWASVYVGKTNYTPINTTDVTITADPEVIPISQGSNTTVVYTITTKEVKGIYWISLAQICGVMPIAIAYPNPSLSDIPVPMGAMHCGALFLNAKILGITGGTAEYRVGEPMQ